MKRLSPLLRLAGVLSVLATTPAWAQAYPSKPVKIVIGFAPGGTPDVFARLIAQQMEAGWGTQVVVENRPGATGNIGAEFVAKAAPDGYTVLYCDSANWAINPHLFAKMAFDPFKDLAPVIQTSVLPVYLTIHPSVPASTVTEFVAYAKQHPGKLVYASPGSGSLHHLTTELFKSMTGIDLVHVPYKGAGPGAVALVAGEVQVAFLSYTSMSQYVNAGRLRLLAVSTRERATALPNVPTVAEAGVPNFAMSSSLGALVPAGTPAEVIAKLHAAFAAAIALPEVSAKMISFGVTSVAGSTPEQFGALMRAEYDTFGKLIKQAGAKID